MENLGKLTPIEEIVMKNQRQGYPKYVKEFGAYKDLQTILCNMRQIEELQRELKVIDEGIAKYTIENDVIALSELTIMKKYATDDLNSVTYRDRFRNYYRY
jgi:hypothetical protein